MLLSPSSDVSRPSLGVKIISGRILAKHLRRGTVDPVRRAQLALKLQRGEVVLGHLTAKQARWMTETDATVLAAMRRMTPPAPRPRVVRSRVTYRRELSDSDLDLLVEKAGHERMLAALDRATQPVANGNGGNGNGGVRQGQIDTFTSSGR
jgi:hypothetical protein